MTGQAEGEFVPVGSLLGEAAAIITGMSRSLSQLGSSLHGEDALRSVSALNQAMAEIGTLDASSAGSGDLLPRLAADSTDVAKHLETLRRIIAEITALAINGKIQAALVATAGVDFTVFTAEIGRLGTLAAAQIEQAVARLSTVRGAIASAIDAESSFVRNEAGELRNIRTRIDANITQMIERDRRAALAIDAVETKSRQVSDKVARTIGELQINDITCQRIEHVRIVLRALAEPDLPWLAELPPDRFRRLALAACRLQKNQLIEAARDYEIEIEALSGNLRGLSHDARDLLAEADGAFGDSRGGLFVTEIEQDVSRAVALLDAYTAAADKTRAMIGAVSQGFVAMSEDLEAIRSIDADMRVMGLNATLKCGRLGNAGQALGVVAQELRACSRRTEDSSRIVGELLKKALETADQLTRRSEERNQAEDQTQAPSRIMTDCVAGLSQLSAVMSQAMDELHRDAPIVADRLAGGADGISFHHRLTADCTEAAETILILADGLEDGQPLGEEDFEALRRLTEAHYTMDSERLIHNRFDGRASPAAAPPPAEESSIDDLFF